MQVRERSNDLFPFRFSSEMVSNYVSRQHPLDSGLLLSDGVVGDDDGKHVWHPASGKINAINYRGGLGRGERSAPQDNSGALSKGLFSGPQDRMIFTSPPQKLFRFNDCMSLLKKRSGAKAFKKSLRARC